MSGALRVFAATTLVVGLGVGMVAGGPAAAAEHGDKTSAGKQAMMEKWEASMAAGPQHEALAALSGPWSVKSSYWVTPDAEPEESEYKAIRTMIFDDRVLREDFTGAFRGRSYVGIGHSGYDNVSGQFWTTWIDNLSTGVTIMTGAWDAEKEKWVLEGQTPDPMADGLVPIRIESVMPDDNTQVDDFYRPGPDGEMFRFMELVYQRLQ